jgi:proteic killer suppression protein
MALDGAETLQDLRIPPGNRLEKLTGSRQGQMSIRVNDQWRICFVWRMAMPTKSKSLIITEYLEL